MEQAGFPFAWAWWALLSSLLHALFYDRLVWMIFGLVLALVALQYRRIAQMRNSFYGVKGYGPSVLVDVFVAAVYGLMGGLVGGYLIILTGLSISGSGLLYLLPVAVILMFINPRLLCFAYSGGLLALTHLLFGFPAISIPQVMALVAILHFVESILILASGHLGAVPTFIRLPGGQVVGGFTLQKFWPIPIVALAVHWDLGKVIPGDALMAMPAWWPLIKPEMAGDPSTMVFVMITLVAGLGYADIATARTPARKSRISALYLAVYSLMLFLLAVLAGTGSGYAWAAALFAPLGHELIIYISKHMELNGRPFYVPDPAGVMALEVLDRSPAWRAGLRSGDVIREINGLPVRTRADLHLSLINPGLKEVGFLQQKIHFRRETVNLRSGEMFGVIPVPEGNESFCLELNRGSLG